MTSKLKEQYSTRERQIDALIDVGSSLKFYRTEVSRLQQELSRLQKSSIRGVNVEIPGCHLLKVPTSQDSTQFAVAIWEKRISEMTERMNQLLDSVL